MSEFYEGIEAGVPPQQVWCVCCHATIIDPAISRVCVECTRIITTNALQSEDK